jgi:hypothetical protein
MLLQPGRYRALTDVIVELCLGSSTPAYTVDSEARYNAGEIFSIPPTNSPWYYQIADPEPGVAEVIAAFGVEVLPPPANRIKRIDDLQAMA